MDHLLLLRDLQATLDHLETVERGLAALPPDLAALEARLKTLARQVAEKTKALETVRSQVQVRSRELAAAQKEEDLAREAVKATQQKVHYVAAMRELDEKERHRTAIAKPLKALEAEASALEAALGALESERNLLQVQFDELHGLFLDEHANQVEGRKLLRSKQADLEAKLPAAEVSRFHRLATARQGRAVVAVEQGACTGCHVKLRGPFLAQLREAKGPMACESCQRILFLP